MNFLFDLHTHTLASGHAYGSFTDNIAAATETGPLGTGSIRTFQLHARRAAAYLFYQFQSHP